MTQDRYLIYIYIGKIR